MERSTKRGPRAQIAIRGLSTLVGLMSVTCSPLLRKSEIPATPPPPSAWRSALATSNGPSSDEQLSAWWQRLGDSTLDQLVDRALAGSLDLQIAATRVEEARARRGVAKADLGPTVSASATAAREALLGDDAADTSNESAAVEAQWEVDLFGRRRLALAASQADLETTIEDLRGARVALLAEVVSTFADLRAAQEQREVITSSLALREETYRLTAWRAEAGLTSALELAQAESSLEQARASLPELEQRADEASRQLEVLCGDLSGALDQLLDRDGQRPQIPQPPLVVAIGIPADVLRQRPDVRGAERSVMAAVARLGSARAERYPSLRVTGSLSASRISDIVDIDKLIANFLASLTAPVFESGRLQQNIAVQRAQVEQAVLTYRQVVLTALSEVENALASYGRTHLRIASLEAASQAAQDAEELAHQRYEVGLVDLQTVLDTQRTRLAIDEELAGARGSLVSTFASLYRALGGGWTADAQGSPRA